eukprot:CAMPEP_0195519372 /NCGR_PEP_ID=MMETSP0794_2-20130614/14609_1 /TAXON_ID=515487 /ORGANISM="Stephanopyxis turris, Strain CCMP 815" /LENGTH=315 /DNA_ID=CAMNT_0040648511 /DNA_START=24 /DNA_END=971 /DNA_ORIENTATION=+
MIDSKIACTACISVLLVIFGVIILPLSFAYIDYYEYGLRQRKTTSQVSTDVVYSQGRYFVGPDIGFLKYQADAHPLHFDNIGVFSDGGSESIGLSFQIDLDLTYFLKKDQVGQLYRDLAKGYENVVISRTNDAIKNSAITVTFKDYFEDRKRVESQFREAVIKRWDEDPPLHCLLDQFHLGRIRIPDSVARKQLESLVQVERNDKESFLQQARIEREMTEVHVNSIRLQKEKILQNTRAEAKLLTANANVKADQIKTDASINGISALLDAVNITSQEHFTAFNYIRNLQNREQLDLAISYLSDSNVVKTRNDISS